jgi:hypothetical protein
VNSEAVATDASSPRIRYFWVVLFAVAFGFVEASVVVYLRALYYPEGFALPLKLMATPHAVIELGREFATLVMLVAVGWMAGKAPWERFAYFMVAFAVWDIFYYVWLKVMLNWPGGLLEWDVLFLIPVPWLGPVIAPVLISLVMLLSGSMIIGLFAQGKGFHPPAVSWILAVASVGLLLYSFVADTAATLHGKFPAPYRYDFLLIGLFCAGAALARALARRSPRSSP